jgi:hypothetical protein
MTRYAIIFTVIAILSIIAVALFYKFVCVKVLKKSISSTRIESWFGVLRVSLYTILGGIITGYAVKYLLYMLMACTIL